MRVEKAQVRVTSGMCVQFSSSMAYSYVSRVHRTVQYSTVNKNLTAVYNDEVENCTFVRRISVQYSTVYSNAVRKRHVWVGIACVRVGNNITAVYECSAVQCGAVVRMAHRSHSVAFNKHVMYRMCEIQ